MENVNGLLSATLETQRIFEWMLNDSRSPCDAALCLIGIRAERMIHVR